MSTKVNKALRRFCLDCQGGSPSFVEDCKDGECRLFEYRMCTVRPLSEEDRPLRAIRRHCIICAGNRSEVRNCDAKEGCPLWSFRFGVLPATFKRVVSRQRQKREELFLPGFERR